MFNFEIISCKMKDIEESSLWEKVKGYGYKSVTVGKYGRVTCCKCNSERVVDVVELQVTFT